MTNPEVRLRTFQAENNIYTKGPLSLVIQFTRLVRERTFPLNPDDFQTSSKGQVAGLGGGNLKKILKEHGITQQLSAEGGRTSRGSIVDDGMQCRTEESSCAASFLCVSKYRYPVCKIMYIASVILCLEDI